MKLYIKSIAFATLALGALSLGSCSEDSVYEVDINAIPLASDYADAVTITVDQATNYATFSFNAPGVYPVWIIDGKSYSTSQSFTRYYRKAGEYSVEVKIGNANGISQGALTKTFTVDHTIMNGFAGFVYDQETNLWLGATKNDPTFYYAPGWAQIADPSYSFDGDAYTLSLPEATTDKWQAQMHIGTDICLNEGEGYDGSFIFTSTKDMNGVTLKIHPQGDDDDAHSFFPQQKINLTAGEPQTFWFSNLVAAVPMNNIVFTLDFGGCPAGVEVTIENFVLKSHSVDDGTVLPELPSEPEPTWAAEDSPANLWSTATISNTFYYAPGWAQIADPKVTIEGNSYTFELPSATFEQWQAQCCFVTDLSAPDMDKLYDFRIVLESTTDIPAAMVKLVEADESEVKHDDNFFFAENVALTAGGKTTFWVSKVKAPKNPMHSINLVLDFGGCPDNTEVKVSGIIFQEHHD